jgi:hypothetical protein
MDKVLRSSIEPLTPSINIGRSEVFEYDQTSTKPNGIKVKLDRLCGFILAAGAIGI